MKIKHIVYILQINLIKVYENVIKLYNYEKIIIK